MRASSPPRSASEEERGQGEERRRPPTTLRSREQTVDERRKRTPERELVRDRLGELELLGEVGRWSSRRHRRAVGSRRQPPRLGSVGAEAIGHRCAREPREFAEATDAELRKLLAAL